MATAAAVPGTHVRRRFQAGVSREMLNAKASMVGYLSPLRKTNATESARDSIGENVAIRAIMQHPAIFAMAPNPWSGPWRNRQHLLTRLARRGWPVIYSNGLRYSWEVIREFRKDARPMGSFQTVDSGVQAFCECAFPFRWPRIGWLDRKAVGYHARQLARAAGVDRPELALVFHPMFFPYVEELDPRRVVYYIYDEILGQCERDQRLYEEWRKLVQRADLIIATTEDMARDLPDDGPARACVLHNGADTAKVVALEGQPCAVSLRDIPRPRIGYSGVVNAKLDYLLVHEIAVRRTDWHWVFVGPEVDFASAGNPDWAAQAEARDLCRKLSNVHFVGALPYPDFLSALHHMDVNVLCNRLDEGWWRKAYPLKFHEYLAAGRPVVSSPINSLLPFESVAAFASGTDEWMVELSRAIEHSGVGSPQSRRRAAAENDWERRADQLHQWLEAVVAGRRAAALAGATRPGVRLSNSQMATD